MTRGVSRKTGRSEGGLPKADPALVARALELYDSGLRSAEEAAAEVGLGMRTVYRALKAREVAVVVEVAALELVILSGLPASGKSTFAREFYPGHACANRDTAGGAVADLLPFVAASLAAGRSVIVDNTLPAAADRAPFVEVGRAHGARVVSVRLESTKEEALARNAGRSGAARVPDVAVYTVAKRLEPVTAGEGFDTLQVARCAPGGGFEVRDAALASAPCGLVLAPEIVEDIFAPPDPERVAAIRRLVVRGTLPGVGEDGKPAELPVEFGADWIERVAEGEGLTPREVRRLLRAAAVEAGLDALPFELARERSIAVAERAGKMAGEAHDWKSLLAAQNHIDRLRFSTSEPDPEGLSRAGVTALFQRVAAELVGVSGGVEALRRALGG